MPGPGRQVHAHRNGDEVTRMLIQIPDVLSREQVAHARRLLDAAEWVDGKVTAGHQSRAGQGQPADSEKAIRSRAKSAR